MDATHYLYLAEPPRPTFHEDATEAEYAVLERHFAYLQQQCDAGRLLLAGPALDGAYGVAILKISALEEAERFVAADPAVREGLFTPVLRPLALGIMTL